MEKKELVITLELVLRFVMLTLWLVSIVISSICGFRVWQFGNKCSIHVTNASKAMGVEEAVKELDIAIQYAEETGRTQGLTTKYGSNDLGIWYRNLLSSKENFNRLDVNSEHYNTEFASVKEGVSQIMFPTYISFYQNSVLKCVGWLWIITFIISIWYLFEQEINYKDPTVIMTIPIHKKASQLENNNI